MNKNIFTMSDSNSKTYDSIPAKLRESCVSVEDMYPGLSKRYFNDATVADANFAFLTTTLAKTHQLPYEPLYNVTYTKDIPIDIGGGFVDYVEYMTVNWAGIMDEYRNVFSNNANYIPRVNAGMTQNRVNVYTFEVAYDLRFIELEKAKQLTLKKSIEQIYNDVIMAGWDFFVQRVAYTGINGGKGLFNHGNVKITMIDNTTANSGFKTMTDTQVVSFFNGIFETYLLNSNMNGRILPDTILVPTFVGTDLSSRFSTLYTATLRSFIIEHNLGMDETQNKITIESRPDLNTLGTGNKGRIVAYKKDKSFVRLDVPYQLKHFITLPNIERMSYTSLFVGQVSEIQLPYNTSNAELGAVSYWDFTK